MGESSAGRFDWREVSLGDAPPNGTQCNFAGWADKNADDDYTYTAPVGSFPANGYGLHDMAGNVWEWCLDEYQADFYSSSLLRNPIAGANSVTKVINSFKNNNLTNVWRVLRGGSWLFGARNLRVAVRDWDTLTYSSAYYGFRCARAVTP